MDLRDWTSSLTRFIRKGIVDANINNVMHMSKRIEVRR